MGNIIVPKSGHRWRILKSSDLGVEIVIAGRRKHEGGKFVSGNVVGVKRYQKRASLF